MRTAACYLVAKYDLGSCTFGISLTESGISMTKNRMPGKGRSNRRKPLEPKGGEIHYHGSEVAVFDPLTGWEATLRAVQGFQATKAYICPECNDEIKIGISHMVVVPIEAPDLRRHWHTYCWTRRSNRNPAPRRQNRE